MSEPKGRKEINMGINTKGLRNAVSESKHLRGFYGPRLEVAYSPEDGVMWTFHPDSNGWSDWKDGITRIGVLSEPTTMKDLREMIEQALET